MTGEATASVVDAMRGKLEAADFDPVLRSLIESKGFRGDGRICYQSEKLLLIERSYFR